MAASGAQRFQDTSGLTKAVRRRASLLAHSYLPKLLGRYGEHYSARLLRRQGYLIIDRNCRTSFGELDLLAADRESLCAIEVKTRSRRLRWAEFRALLGAELTAWLHAVTGSRKSALRSARSGIQGRELPYSGLAAVDDLKAQRVQACADVLWQKHWLLRRKLGLRKQRYDIVVVELLLLAGYLPVWSTARHYPAAWSFLPGSPTASPR